MKTKTNGIVKLIIAVLILVLAMFSSKVEAAEKYDEFYELDGNYITRILPQTSVRDLKNNLDSESIVVKTANGEALDDDKFVGSGMTLEINGNNYTASVVGDLDGNGIITITDFIKLRHYMTNIITLEDWYVKAGDINNDGNISITDLSQLNLAVVRIKDIIAPETFIPETSFTKNTLTVSGETVDSNSGVAEYFFKIDNGNWVQNTSKTNGKYTFENIDFTQQHTVKMKVKDNAGNEKKTQTIVVNKQNKAIEIIPSTTEWTNEDITVVVEYDSNIDNTEKLISTDGGQTFTKYTGPVTVSKNTRIVAQIKRNYAVIEETSYDVTNIDKLDPKEFTPAIQYGKNSIQVDATTEDADATSEYGKSGMKEYEYVLKMGFWKWAINLQDNTYTFGALESKMNYDLEITAIDNAGNKRSYEEKNVKPKPEYTLEINANGGEYVGETTIVKTEGHGSKWTDKFCG